MGWAEGALPALMAIQSAPSMPAVTPAPARKAEHEQDRARKPKLLEAPKKAQAVVPLPALY